MIKLKRAVEISVKDFSTIFLPQSFKVFIAFSSEFSNLGSTVTKIFWMDHSLTMSSYGLGSPGVFVEVDGNFLYMSDSSSSFDGLQNFKHCFCSLSHLSRLVSE